MTPRNTGPIAEMFPSMAARLTPEEFHELKRVVCAGVDASKGATLSHSFIWCETPQGSDYWRGVQLKYWPNWLDGQTADV